MTDRNIPDEDESLPIPLKEWVQERLVNCMRLADTKTGADRDGWLEDARYFRVILHRLGPETSGDGPLPRQLIEALQRAKVARAKHDAGRVTDLHERDLRFMLTEIERLRGPVKSNEQPTAPAAPPLAQGPASSTGPAAGAVLPIVKQEPLT